MSDTEICSRMSNLHQNEQNCETKSNLPFQISAQDYQELICSLYQVCDYWNFPGKAKYVLKRYMDEYLTKLGKCGSLEFKELIFVVLYHFSKSYSNFDISSKFYQECQKNAGLLSSVKETNQQISQLFKQMSPIQTPYDYLDHLYPLINSEPSGRLKVEQILDFAITFSQFFSTSSEVIFMGAVIMASYNEQNSTKIISLISEHTIHLQQCINVADIINKAYLDIIAAEEDDNQEPTFVQSSE